MRVLFIASEAAPWSKSGGLGDVCGALPAALVARGHTVALVTPGKSPDEVEKALISEFDTRKAEGINERELQRAKNQFSRDYILSRLSIKEKASQMGHAEVIQKDMATADGEFDTFLKVTTADTKRTAQQYFVPERRMVMRIMPRGGLENAQGAFSAYGAKGANGEGSK